jgi:peptidoglycan/LPS O-acetylase OafA/YrhL
MGLFRFFLALAVIFAHSAPLFGFDFTGGPVAVEAFFIISGFYIALILNEKYVRVDNSYWLFISNRFLRLFPMYWVALILTLICTLLIPHFNEHALSGGLAMYQRYGTDLSTTAYLYFFITNIFVFFQDTALFLGLDLKTGGFFYTHTFQATNPLVWKFELIPQAWSIGLEMAFYLIAPFIVRRKWWVVVTVLMLSAIFKFVGSQTGYRYDPWSYRFFPFELMYFLLGSIGYILYRKYLHKVSIPNFLSLSMFIFIVAFTVVFTKFPFRYAYPLYIFCTFSFMPFLFKYTKEFKWDRWVGELSYPLYITHMLVLNISKVLQINHLNVATIIGSIALSILLNKFVGNRVERMRQSRVTATKDPLKNTNHLSVKLQNT